MLNQVIILFFGVLLVCWFILDGTTKFKEKLGILSLAFLLYMFVMAAMGARSFEEILQPLLKFLNHR